MGKHYVTTVTVITPQMAETMLKDSRNNRNINKSDVSLYAKEMLRGRWRPDPGEPIIYAKDGTLIDGHHRLNAVLKAGIPVEMSILRGVDIEDQKIIDTGSRRATRDFLTIAGIPNSHHVSSAIRYFWTLKKEWSIRGNIPGAAHMGFTNEDALDEYNSSPELYQGIVRFAQSLYKKSGFLKMQETGGICAFLVKERSHDIALVESFYRELFVGGKYPVIVYVRALLIRSRDAEILSEKADSQKRRVVIAKAWNAFLRDDRNLTRVTYKLGEKAKFD